MSANTGLPINSSTKIHIAVDITGWGAIVGSVALLAGTGLMLAAIARAFLRPVSLEIRRFFSRSSYFCDQLYRDGLKKHHF